MKTGKLVSIVLTLAMLLSVLPMSAMAYGGEGKDQTAEIKVSFTKDDDKVASASLVTKKDNSATLTIPNSTIEGYDTVTVSVDRWSDTDSLLHYSMPYKGSDSINIGNIFSSFHDFGAVPKALHVQVKDGLENESADYSLRYSEGTFCATPGSGEADAAQNVWEALSDGSRIAVTTKSDDDSKIILPFGSAIYLKSTDSSDETYYESITVTGPKLKLDHFDDLNSMAAEIASNTAYSQKDDPTNTDAYKLILKAGTTIAVKTRVITILKDLTITLNGGDAFFAAINDPLYYGYYGLNGLYYSFVDVYSQPNSQTAKLSVSGTSAAEAAARIVDAIFAGLKAGTNNTLKFTFATSTDIVSYSEGYVTLYTADNANSAVTSADQGDVLVVNSDVTIGNTSNTANQISVAANSTITVESDATATVGTNTVKAAEITYTDSTTKQTQTAVVVSKTTGTTTTTAALPKTLFIKDDSVANKDASATEFSDFVQPAAVVANAVAKNSAIDVSEITKVELKLEKTKQDSIESLDEDIKAAVSTAVSTAQAESKTATVYEVHPVATIKTTSNTYGTPYTVTKEQIVKDAQFTFTLNFGAENEGKTVTLTHYANDGTIKPHGDKYSWDETIDSKGDVSVTLDSFSYVLGVLENSTPTSSDAMIVGMNGVFADRFILNFYVTTNEENPIFTFTRTNNRTNSKETLVQKMTKEDFLDSDVAVYFVQKVDSNGTNLLGLKRTYNKTDEAVWMISVLTFTQYLDRPVTISMKNGSNEKMGISGYSYQGTGSSELKYEHSYAFTDYLQIMADYNKNNTGTYYSSLKNAFQSTANAVHEIDLINNPVINE